MSEIISKNPVKVSQPTQLNNLPNNTLIEIVCPNCQKVYQSHVYAKKYKVFNKMFLCKTCSYKQTCIEKYGVDNMFKTNKVKEIVKNRDKKFYEKRIEKSKRTKIEKYGSLENASNVMKAHLKETMLQKYGVDNIFKNKKYIEECTFKKFGRKNIFSGEEGKEIAEKGMLKKHGVRRALQKREFQEKYKQTSLKKYGVDNFAKTDSHTEKMQKTNFQKFGQLRSPSYKYVYKNARFDSSWELAFWIYCEDHGKNIKRESRYFEYFVEGKMRKYFPDFEVDGVYYEIKGDQFFTKDGKMQNPFDHSLDVLFEAKQTCMQKHGIIVLSKKEIQKYLDYVIQTRGENFFESCKKN